MFQPTGIIKMTNVAFIKYKINNKKFEIACYKNKAINWRNGVEKDIGEVLQMEEVFTNASHGTIAKKTDLQLYFGNMKKMEIIKLILEKGELQVGDKERQVQLQSLQNDIINIITEKCVHPDSQRKFSTIQVQQAVKSIGFKVKPDQPAKKQALECIRLLLKKFYMHRAEMLISFNLPAVDKQVLLNHFEQLEIDEQSIQKTVVKDSTRIELVVSIEPSKFRLLNQCVKEKMPDCVLEVISNVLTNDAVEGIENSSATTLKIRDDWKGDEEAKEQEKDSSKTKAKKEVKDQKEMNEEQKECEKESNDEGEEEETSKKLKKKKKKNPQLDARMQQEKEKEFQIQQIKLEELQKQNLQRVEEEMSKLNIKKETAESAAQKGCKKCTSCKDAYFETNDEYRSHFKSEWHIFNVKRKSTQESLLSEVEFRTHNLDANFK